MSDRFNTISEIKHILFEADDPKNEAGPTLLVDGTRQYTYCGEGHIAVYGNTGMGKSSCVVLPFMRQIFNKHESLIMLDPKGEGYRRNIGFVPSEYQMFCINFKKPRKSPHKWNPLSAISKLYHSENMDDKDLAAEMVSELYDTVYPKDSDKDVFWPQSAANFAKGLTYGLLDVADENEINLESVCSMMENAEINDHGKRLSTKFYEAMRQDSLARRCLAAYVTAPNETRGSIHSFASSGIEIFCRSTGLMQMLSEDTLNMLDIDLSRPFVIFVILPDETNIIDPLAGVLISQLSRFIIRGAEQFKDSRLPIRVNFILEELGSIGKAIPTLPNLMVASRSRNCRLMLVLQSKDQLADVYGELKAKTIDSCVGVTIAFSTNSWETLEEWSKRCGQRREDMSGYSINIPVITPVELAAMPIGSALIFIGNRYKFISHLPIYTESSDESSYLPETKCTYELHIFSMTEFCDSISRTDQISDKELLRHSPMFCWKMSEDEKSDEGKNLIDSIIARIDEKIAEIEAEEENKSLESETEDNG